ncbi:plasmid partitioning protein RepB [Rhizobium sp. S152]|uniref:plasmid partitioning protein RepB n=1 Tax=Rhizobium sp. S152 TaxID=3055038 RepID=UPI0025A9CB57|nr:plasmid partitioning protein RepB [Rhizobium sp. S152]MDM9628002.1 plasmid partitioning protein RepB [Rhizobium sp. S152]
MARKNLIGISETPNQAPAPSTTRNDRPIAGFIPAARPSSPVGGITRTLGNITEKVERAQTLERQLAEGQTVVELDPVQIDASFVNDRLSIDALELSQLVEQIRDYGQQVPILVRPHPDQRERFQVAYGHRRLAAARQLGIKIKAVVRQLSDEQLVVSQGQENNSRTDLSYIERGLFATRLEDRGFARDVIMAALGVDKAALSRMISVVRQIPEPVIVAIGAAPAVGRRRWMELADSLLAYGDSAAVLEFATKPSTSKLPSDERFDALVAFLITPKARPATAWVAHDTLPVKMKHTATGATFVFNTKAAPGFDQFVERKLADLYAEYRQQSGD